MSLLKPQKLNKGDTVATVSLSWGGAGEKDILWRYHQGKARLEQEFGLKVVEMPHTLKNAEYIYNHPEKRAEDLMEAFSNKSIKAIFSCIGGDDSIRMLPYIDFNVIKNNPKIFMGYSDSTVSHFMCLKAGLSSFYGPALLTDFAENVEMSLYTIQAVKHTLFSNKTIGTIFPSDTFTAQYLPWLEENKNIKRDFKKNNGYELMQGAKTVQGRLIGGCLEVMNNIRGTSLFPANSCFDQSILFLETSEVQPPVWYVEDSLRTYGAMGLLDRISGMFWGKPQNEKIYKEYIEVIKKVLHEFGRADMPVLYNGSFGHNEPKTILPYGALAEINCVQKSFSILESGVF